MRNRSAWIIASAIVFIGAALFFWHAMQGPSTQIGEPTSSPSDEQAAATVQTVPIRVGDISENLIAYGTVTSEPALIDIYSRPIDVRVLHVRVSAGQSVARGAPLVDVEPSADSLAQLLDARNGLEAAKANLKDAQQRVDLKLATNTDLLMAQQAVQSAQLKLDNLQQRGVGEGRRTILADADSIVVKVDVQDGQLITASGPLVELLPRGQVEVRLGVDPIDVSSLKPGQAVQLFQETGPADGISGTIRSIAERINPESHLVDVYVAPPSNTALMLDSFVRGGLTIASGHVMIVPHDAMVPSDQGYVLFTVKDGKAVKHSVNVKIQNDREAAVASDDLHEGDPVVTLGALEIDDGDAVSIEAGATAEENPPTTEQGK